MNIHAITKRGAQLVCAAAAMLAFSTTASVALAAPLSFSCTVADVTVFPDRVHIRCATAGSDGVGNNILFFAVSTADVSASDRLITLGATALAAGRPLLFSYDSIAANHSWSNVPGCLTNNCRIPYAFSMQ